MTMTLFSPAHSTHRRATALLSLWLLAASAAHAQLDAPQRSPAFST